MKLNNDQRKHLSTTLRTIGIGALVPVGFKIYGSDLSILIVLIWVLIAAWFEWLAIKILGGIEND